MMTKEKFERQWGKANLPLDAIHLIFLKGISTKYIIRATGYDFSAIANEVMLYLENIWVARLPLSIVSWVF